MYALPTKPYKLIAKTRRGITQKVDTLESSSTSSRESGKSGALTADMSSPKPVFHQVNGRRSQAQKYQTETYTQEHEEIIKYIQGSWTSVHNEYESTKHLTDGKVPKVVYYQDNSTNQHLKNFQPFDLEAFWGERFLQNIKQST